MEKRFNLLKSVSSFLWLACFLAFMSPTITWAQALDASEAEGKPDHEALRMLSDYLAQAALKNPELEAAFHRWKAALEKIPQVRALPDPRFTFAYFIGLPFG